MGEPEELAALHKYFLNASAMKRHYEDRVHQQGLARSPEHPDWAEQWIYLSLWYATLFVVAEGWVSGNFNDSEIASLLEDAEKWRALRRFRNGTLHFQTDYFDRRLVDFVVLGADSAEWVRALHSALGRGLLTHMAGSPPH